MGQEILLAQHPEIVLLLEKYSLLPERKKGGTHAGCAKKWAREGRKPYDEPKYQALAERLNEGWETVTEEEFFALLKKVDRTIAEYKKGDLHAVNSGNRIFFKQLIQTSLLLLTHAATDLMEKGIAIFPGESAVEKEIAKKLSFELVIHLLDSAEVLQTLMRTLTGVLDISQKSQETLARFLKLFLLLAGLLVASENHEETFKEFLTTFKSSIFLEVLNLEQFLIEQNATSDSLLLIRQGKMALEKEDINQFYIALEEMLDMLDIDKERLIKNFATLQSLTRGLGDQLAASKENKENQKTTLEQAM